MILRIGFVAYAGCSTCLCTIPVICFLPISIRTIAPGNSMVSHEYVRTVLSDLTIIDGATSK